MEKDQYITYANAMLFGLKKGFEASIQYLRRIAAHMPDDASKAVVAKLADDLEKYSINEQANLLKAAIAMAAKKNADSRRNSEPPGLQ